MRATFFMSWHLVGARVLCGSYRQSEVRHLESGPQASPSHRHAQSAECGPKHNTIANDQKIGQNCDQQQHPPNRLVVAIFPFSTKANLLAAGGPVTVPMVPSTQVDPKKKEHVSIHLENPTNLQPPPTE